MTLHTNATFPSEAVFVLSPAYLFLLTSTHTHKCLYLFSSLSAITSDHAQTSPPRLINICHTWFSTWIPSYLTMASVTREFLFKIT